MTHAFIRHVTDPRYQRAVQRANEARAASLREGLGRLRTAFARALRLLSARRRARHNRALLHGLSDDQLDDIGLTRGEVSSISGRLATLPPDVSVTVEALRTGPPPATKRPRAGR